MEIDSVSQNFPPTGDLEGEPEEAPVQQQKEELLQWKHLGHEPRTRGVEGVGGRRASRKDLGAQQGPDGQFLPFRWETRPPGDSRTTVLPAFLVYMLLTHAGGNYGLEHTLCPPVTRKANSLAETRRQRMEQSPGGSDPPVGSHRGARAPATLQRAP